MGGDAMTAQAHSAPMAMLRGMWQRNHELLRNAGSLFGFVRPCERELANRLLL